MGDVRTKIDALKDLGDKVTGKTINVEENDTIVGMIDKIAENYSGGGSDYPFPQEPKVLTRAWLYEGEKIIIDFAKMKNMLLSKDIDLSGYITSSSSSQGGEFYFAYEMDGETTAGQFMTYIESNQWVAEISIDGSSTREPFYTTGGITVGDLLNSMSTQTIEINTYNARYINFGHIKFIDIEGNENEVELTADEVVTYLSFE